MKNIHKIYAATIATALLTPTIITPIHTVEASTIVKKFSDVTEKNQNYNIIHEMVEMGIIKGYSDNTFRGGNAITRYQAATLIYRYIGEGQLAVRNPSVKIPNDVSPKSEHYKATVVLLKVGLLTADQNNKLNPNQPITRAEMAKILVGAFDLQVKATYDFTDTINGDEETRDAVRALYSNGITTGYLEDATFRPEKSLTRQQFAVFMHRSINVDPDYVAPPIEIPEKEDTTSNGSTNSGDTTKPTDNDLTNSQPATAYDVNDLSLSNPSVYEKYSGEVEDIKTEHISTPKLSLNATELKNYQAELMLNYSNAKVLYKKSVVPAYKFTAEDDTLEYYSQYVFKIPVKEIVKLLQYVQDTGEVYKGDTFAIYYAYKEQDATRGRHYHIAYK